MATDTLEPPPETCGTDSAKRRQILEGARRIFLSAGFDGASMGEIAKAARVSKGTLYVYFDSKEALFEALTLEEKAGLAEALFRLDESDPDVRSAMRRLGISFLEAMLRPDHISSIRMVIGATDKFPRFGRAFYEAGPQTGARRLQAYLDAQVAAGRLRIDDTRTAAEQFLSLCSTNLFRRAIFGVGPKPEADDIAREIEAALTVFFAAYGTA
ncbi:TetR/AcrR family transcriptional regulator [Enterovirga aerilata]|uniref:TetR/AcrR family transcriptional regulator n=1 Tax=Enterovirga aerilata TaxID=2730920 RepID=A0A849IC10_9HYPH|nr:TetR/AcrR family transcriptional regulator [Enterovirga sp. DB1703]NNM71463.1 TetR/AcrR family transcriptional regulator [Enterovirga sp. DB1703]